MHCWSACVSSAREMSLECRRALCNCQSTMARKHVLSECLLRLLECIVSRMCTVGAPSATAGALCLYCWSDVTLEHVLSKRPMQLRKRCGSRACIAGAPFEITGAHFHQKK
ncbi:hypothetical protein AMTRI_Chr11g93900 [Amborella trichopoda]